MLACKDANPIWSNAEASRHAKASEETARKAALSIVSKLLLLLNSSQMTESSMNITTFLPKMFSSS